MKTKENIEFPFKVGQLYEFIGEDSDPDFDKGGFYRYLGKNTFETLRGEEVYFEGEWGEDNPVQDSFKYTP